ncbi:MAG: gluconate 2-dehydrogenase subunit 3 family protein [Candidatus Bathyarchaeota archaeon]|nr:gluconate 2-dehydrogenase subunit 3 family protein [Candidatus Bathyarchaeota archaeon]
MPISRREFIKISAAGAVGFGVASAIEIPILENQISNERDQITALNNQVSTLQNQLSTTVQEQEAFLTLGVNEQKEVEAIVETIIPSDQNGLGAKEAGVIFFIDHQLAGDYGNNARMYMKGPFVLSGQTGPITVGGITYPQGSPVEPFTGPTYQYNLTLREFWRTGLLALEAYSNSVYGKNFEDLTTDQRTQILTDLYNNKPTSFNDIVPKDFFNELIFMTYSGFMMDPVYGGNNGMVGWILTGFTGANMGDSFNQGRNVLDLMVADKPTRFPPHSLGEFQKIMGEL